jgi:hypothetical protein
MALPRLHARRAALTAGAVVLLAGGSAFAAAATTKRGSTTKTIAAGKTVTVAVPYPDALKYGNATYSGRAVVRGPAPGATGSAPSLAKVTILSKGSVLGGSEYQVRAHNGNAPGTAPVRLEVIATTVEPLPHS